MAWEAGAATGLEKSEKRRVQAARNGPSEDRKYWQRLELGIHYLNRCAVKCLEMYSNSRSLECHSSWFAHFDSDSLNRHHPDVEKDLRYGLQGPEPARF